LLGGAVYFVTSANTASSVLNPQVALVGTDGSSNGSGRAANPLDQLSSTEIAVHVSRMSQMETAIAVTNQADSVSSSSSVVSHDDTLVANPKIMTTDIKTKDDIFTYTVEAGDTVGSLANKFGVTSDSIRWSNELSAWQALRVGQELVIPPIDGIVYTVQADDDPESLAQRFNADEDLIIRFNDAELDGLQAGERIVIPDGERRPQQTAAPATSYYGFSFGSRAIYGYNGYVPGYCTYYVASRVSVPTNWGNARNWAAGARATSGWTVDTTPRPGSIAQTTAMHWLGHVAVVEEVSEDGSMIRYSDMNGLAGFNRVGTSDWVPVTTYQYYIHRN
jgi:surface antigen